MSGTTNVNLGAFTNSATVTGSIGMNGGGSGTVYFTSGNGNLDTNTGAATVFLTSGNNLTDLTFFLLGGQGFGSAEFNLEQGDPSSFTVLLTDSLGDIFNASLTHLQGSNIFDVVAPAGFIITSVHLTTTGGGFKDLKQLRLTGGTIALPEPATWAMMLLGFGGIGMAMRRRRRSASTLMQIA
ncbi:MAG: PEPxxWA-CTERM sorting domain-containing protein [Sphingomonas sp.]